MNINNLGSMLTEDRCSTREIISKINQVKCAIQSKKIMFISKNIVIKVRINLLMAFVWNITLYGSDTWIIGKAEEKRLLAFETFCYGRMFRINWTEHTANEEVYRRVGESRSFLKSLKTRRAFWIIEHTYCGITVHVEE